MIVIMVVVVVVAVTVTVTDTVTVTVVVMSSISTNRGYKSIGIDCTVASDDYGGRSTNWL